MHDLHLVSLLSKYHTVKTLAVKSVANKDCRKFGRKNFHELKSICIVNVMEIVNIGKNLVKCCNSPNLPKFFPHQCFLLYGSDQFLLHFYIYHFKSILACMFTFYGICKHGRGIIISYSKSNCD